ncbi:hypothetical protein [Cohnella zeiphila]|uniref:Uncharacterized protein n=1 Tax=Cohnella zeiphila TaxID=2761120 RepID=A0A7X0VW83_9BACL|nr:hypothetical protein [Cohnella zeiphila]MBB6732924.1 hypothetical protein [Cohnella zeiphila]
MRRLAPGKPALNAKSAAKTPHSCKNAVYSPTDGILEENGCKNAVFLPEEAAFRPFPGRAPAKSQAFPPSIRGNAGIPAFLQV